MTCSFQRTTLKLQKIAVWWGVIGFDWFCLKQYALDFIVIALRMLYNSDSFKTTVNGCKKSGIPYMFDFHSYIPQKEDLVLTQ